MVGLKSSLLLAAVVLLSLACDNPFSPETINSRYTGIDDEIILDGDDSYESYGDDYAGGASSISPGGSQSHTLTPGDYDWVTVYLQSGYRYTIQTTGSIDNHLFFYNTDGSTEITNNDDGGDLMNGLITVTITTTGYYFLKVEGNSTFTTGPYGLSVSSGTYVSGGGDVYDPADDVYTGAVTVSAGNAYPRTLVANDNDWFSVSLSAGYAYTIQTTGSYDTYIYLYDTDGSTILKSADQGGTSNNGLVSHTITTSGVYFIRAKGYYGTELGSYGLSISFGTQVVVPNRDLVSEVGALWEGAPFAGATGTTGTITPTSGMVTASYSADPWDLVNSIYPEYDLSVISSGTFTGMTAMTATYQCADSILVLLPSTDTAAGFFYATLPSSAGSYASATLPISAFVQADPVGGTLDVSTIDQLVLVPQTWTKGIAVSGTLSISKLELIGVAP